MPLSLVHGSCLPYEILLQVQSMRGVSVHWVNCSQPCTSVLQIKYTRRSPLLLIARVGSRGSPNPKTYPGLNAQCTAQMLHYWTSGFTIAQKLHLFHPSHPHSHVIP